MKDMRNAMYLESIISFNDMKAFVCQNREDQDKFSNQVTCYTKSLAHCKEGNKVDTPNE